MKKRATKRATKAKVYHWFQGASVVELYRRLGAAGPETARLEVHQQGKQMTFVVKADGITALDEDPPINDSRVCPPICP